VIDSYIIFTVVILIITIFLFSHLFTSTVTGQTSKMSNLTTNPKDVVDKIMMNNIGKFMNETIRPLMNSTPLTTMSNQTNAPLKNFKATPLTTMSNQTNAPLKNFKATPLTTMSNQTNAPLKNFKATNNDRTANSPITSSDSGSHELDWSLLVMQFVISGLAAGGALLGSNIALDWYRKPSLSVDIGKLPKSAQIDLDLYKVDNPVYGFKVQYIVNRISIRNNGKNAAKNCKGIIKINKTEEKICWYVPNERYKMTINADSIEYLDICAVLNEDPELIFKNLYNKVEKEFGNSGEAKTVKNSIEKSYKNYKDIPAIISPTEHGWLPVNLNRRLDPGIATIVVTAENVKPSLKEDIVILNSPKDNGTIIELSKKNGTRRHNLFNLNLLHQG
jgi:hypothetical protein